MIYRTLYLSIIGALLIGCSTLKNVQSTGDIKDQSLRKVIVQHQQGQAQFDQLHIRGKIKTDIDGKTNTAGIRMQMEPNEKIWVNVSAFAINVARAMITPEGVQGYEKIEKTYIDGNFDFFNQKLKVDFLDFTKLENLLLGNLFLIEDYNAYGVEFLTDEYAIYYKKNDDLNAQSNASKGYIHTFYLDTNYKLKRVEIKDPNSNTNIRVFYDEWVFYQDQTFPTKIKIVVSGNKKDKVELEYSNFEFEQAPTPFRIPENYTPRQID